MMSARLDESTERVGFLHLAARALLEAERECMPIRLLTRSMPDLTVEEAYKIADLRNAACGLSPLGYKLGYTSAAMRAQMGIEDPNYGRLFAAQAVTQGTIASEELIHPRIEAELTVLMGKELAGPDTGWEAAWDAVAAVMPSLEVVDTRYESYHFTAVDNISDNSSAARFVLGEHVLRSAIANLRDVAVELSCNGQVIDTGWGRDAMGDPIVALAWLANVLYRSGTSLKAGDLVMTGGLTRAHAARSGDIFSAHFNGLGAVSVKFSGEK